MDKLQRRARCQARAGGARQHIFVDPAYPQQSGWHTYLNKMLSRLNGKLLKQNPKLTSPVTYDMEGVRFTFNKVNTYSLLSTLAPAVITKILLDTDWVPPQYVLTFAHQDKGQKRKAEDELAKEAETTDA